MLKLSKLVLVWELGLLLQNCHQLKPEVTIDTGELIADGWNDGTSLPKLFAPLSREEETCSRFSGAIRLSSDMAIVDIPIPAIPFSQKTRLLPSEVSASQRRISAKTASRVPGKHVVGAFLRPV